MLNYMDQRTDNRVNLSTKEFGWLADVGWRIFKRGKNRQRKVPPFFAQGDPISMFKKLEAECVCSSFLTASGDPISRVG